MSIEGGWWTVTPEIKYETCPICNGVGVDTRTLGDCRYCCGSGEIKVEEVEEEDDD